jgi:hypothetical protein
VEDFLVLLLAVAAAEALALRRVVSLMEGSLLLGVDFLLRPDGGVCATLCL